MSNLLHPFVLSCPTCGGIAIAPAPEIGDRVVEGQCEDCSQRWRIKCEVAAVPSEGAPISSDRHILTVFGWVVVDPTRYPENYQQELDRADALLRGTITEEYLTVDRPGS